jgi:ATP/maltotriose-dependent transcriptional regulator MalT
MLGRGLVETVRGWLDALPADACEASPHLLFLGGQCVWQRGAMREAYALLERAASGLAAAGDPASEGEGLAYLTAGAFMQGEYPRAHTYARQALERPLNARTRVRLLLERGRRRRGDPPERGRAQPPCPGGADHAPSPARLRPGLGAWRGSNAAARC